MLAGPKTIHAVVDAAAGIVPVGEIANLDLVESPSPRAHAECTIRPILRLQRCDLGNLGASTPLPYLDLVRVTCVPAQQLRLFQNLASSGLAFFRHARIHANQGTI